MFGRKRGLKLVIIVGLLVVIILGGVYFYFSEQIFYSPPEVGLWHLNGDVADSAGSVNGVIVGDVDCSTMGMFNGACSFDGSGDYIDFGNVNLGEGASTLTVSAWVKNGLTSTTIDRGIMGLSGVYELFWQDTEKLGFRVVTTQGGVTSRTNTLITDSNWHHLVGVYDGNNVKIYLDKILQNNQPVISGSVGSSSKSLYIGKREGQGNWNGSIDEVAIFDKALTQTEVNELFNAESGGGCTENWVCSGYGACVNDLKNCNAVKDINSCGTTYTGDYSEFASQNCAESCTNGQTKACGIDIGECVAGTQTCSSGIWGSCIGGTGPVTEVCGNGLDEDCNGSDLFCSGGGEKGALQFGGHLDYVTLPDMISGLNKFAVSMWFKSSDENTGNSQRLLEQVGSGRDPIDLRRESGSNNGKFRVTLDNGISKELSTSDVAYLDTNWHNVIVSWNGTIIEIYIDGVRGDTTPGVLAGSLAIGGSGLHIGSDNNGLSANGTIDDVRIYNSALSSSDASTLFNGGRDSNVVTTNLIGWWKFNEGSGVVAGDSSGGGNDGSIQGATWIVEEGNESLSDIGCGNDIVESGEQCDDRNIASGDGCSSSCLVEGCEAGHIYNRDGTCTVEYKTRANIYDGYVTCTYGSTGTLKSCSYNDDNNEMDLAHYPPTSTFYDDIYISAFVEWQNIDLSPDDIIESIQFKYYRTDSEDTGIKINDLFVRPSQTDLTVQTELQALSEDIRDGSEYYIRSIPDYTLESRTDIVTLFEQAKMDFKNKIDSGENWFAIGINPTVPRETASIRTLEYPLGGNSFYPTLIVTYTPPITVACGNGVVDSWEQCDDGNNLDGDGCSMVCTNEVCGNNVIDYGEQCDDGNNLNWDGCSAVCTDQVPCGDGVVNSIDYGEQCDDGNNLDGDGCSSICQIEYTGCAPFIYNGDSNSKLDLLFIGDDFLSMGEFQNALLKIVDYDQDIPYSFMNVEPWKSNKDKFNIWYMPEIYSFDYTIARGFGNQIATVALGCPQADYVNVLSKKGFRSHAFFGGTTFNSLCLNMSLGGAICNFDNPLVDLEDSRVFTHEFGHSFGILADEYVEESVGDFPRTPNCADSQSQASNWWGDLVVEADIKTIRAVSYSYYNWDSCIAGDDIVNYQIINDRRRYHCNRYADVSEGSTAMIYSYTAWNGCNGGDIAATTYQTIDGRNLYSCMRKQQVSVGSDVVVYSTSRWGGCYVTDTPTSYQNINGTNLYHCVRYGTIPSGSIKEVGYFDGCSYTADNVRPTFNSIMRNHMAIDGYGAVNMRQLNQRLGVYT